MSSEIGPLARDFTLIPKSLDEATKIGDLIAKSGFAPKGYVGKPADVIIGIQMGLDVGLSPMQALQSIAVINGKPSIYGDAAIALVYRSGQLEFLDAPEPPGPLDDALTAVVKIKRKGQSEVVRTFSVADAKRAKLWGKEGPWTNYPRRMLMLRARAFAVRDTFADVLLGLGIAEESQDIELPAPETKVEVVPMPRELPAQTVAAVAAPTETTPAPVEPTPAAAAPTPAPPPTPAPNVAEIVARLPKLVEATDANRYLGRQPHRIVNVWQPVAGHAFWGIKTGGEPPIFAHTHDEKVALSLKELVHTDHDVYFSGAMVEHDNAPLQVHDFTIDKPPAAPAQTPAPVLPAADELRF